MKNLKFRAWDSENNKMLHIGKFSLYHEKDNGLHSGKENKQGDWYNLPLMQFIGLIDKNGVEIYEGDILLDEEFDEYGNDISSRLEVVFDEEKAQFALDNSYAKDKSHLVNIIDYLGSENLQVVGNIYENINILK